MMEGATKAKSGNDKRVNRNSAINLEQDELNKLLDPVSSFFAGD